MEKRRGQKNLSKEIIAENFPNLENKPDIQVQEGKKAPKEINPKRSTPKRLIMKCQKLRRKS